LNTIRVVIADDHRVFRSALRVLLEKEAGIQVVGEAGSGPEVLEVIKQHNADILILDISMPGMSGLAIVEAILQEEPEFRILVLTMHDEEHYVRELLASGVRGYILKSSPDTELYRALRIVHQGNIFLDVALMHMVVAPYAGKPEAGASGGLGLLSQREQEICRLLARGYSHARVGQELGLSPRTVQSHRANLMKKLGLKARVDLVRFALETGLLPETPIV